VGPESLYKEVETRFQPDRILPAHSCLTPVRPAGDRPVPREKPFYSAENSDKAVPPLSLDTWRPWREQLGFNAKGGPARTNRSRERPSRQAGANTA